MAKSLSNFVCQSCGAVSSKWAGRCDNCGEWNTIIEEKGAAPVSGAKGASLPKGKASRLVGLRGESPSPPRIQTGIAELETRSIAAGIYYLMIKSHDHVMVFKIQKM